MTVGNKKAPSSGKLIRGDNKDNTHSVSEKCFGGNQYERFALGSYLSGASISPGITAAMFSSEVHKIIFIIIRELMAQEIQPDVSILAGELSKRGKLEAVGCDMLAALTNGVFPSNVTFYEGEVLREYHRRSALTAAMELQEALKSNLAPDSLIEDTVKKLSGITAAGQQKNIGILFSDLVKKKFPPDSWHIENLIGSGLTILTGASKIGKSWTALQLVVALDQGGNFMGQLMANRCDTLYLCLEDTPKRIQRRLLKQGITVAFNGSRLETNRCTVSALRAYLKVNPQFKVVIIDTLQKFLGMNDLNDYAQTVDGLGALKVIADDLDRAIIVVHHSRKNCNSDTDHMESALGSTGINATADCTLTMIRKRGSSEATLSVTGRDVEDAYYSLTWDRDLCSWSVPGQGSLKPALPEAQQQIIDLLESEDRVWLASELIEKAGKSSSAMGNLLTRMKADGLIENPKHGQWQQKSKFTNSHTLRESEYVNLDNEGLDDYEREELEARRELDG